MLIKGSSRIHLTEDPEKVRSSIENIFPGSKLEMDGLSIFFSTDIVDNFIKVLMEQQIRDTAGMVLERNTKDDTTSFNLNKQAAFMGNVNFADGDSALGDIEVEVPEGASEFIEMIRPH